MAAAAVLLCVQKASQRSWHAPPALPTAVAAQSLWAAQSDSTYEQWGATGKRALLMLLLLIAPLPQFAMLS